METTITKQHFVTNEATSCHHCGETCEETINSFGFDFCCQGCVTVFDILSTNGLENYYKLENSPGLTPTNSSNGKFAFLTDTETAQKLYCFESGNKVQIELNIPAIHCISCIWLLENLSKIDTAIIRSEVNFGKKTARILFNNDETNLQKVAELLTSLGYEPDFNLADADGKKKKVDRSLVSKVAVAGFCFGNIMLFSFPHYLGLNLSTNATTAKFFSSLNLILGIPVFFYCGFDYIKSALNLVKNKTYSLDLPIFLGMVALFFQSYYEILTASGAGYMDSLAGLMFFLLLGRFFQQKTYNRLSFERDYKAFFPLWTTVLVDNQEVSKPLNKVAIGNLLKIRSSELIPTDAILKKGIAQIDYSFVTGETDPQDIKIGEKLFAGGRQCGASIEIEVTNKPDHSYLTQLWQNTAFTGTKNYSLLNIKAGLFFTIAITIIATGAALAHNLLNTGHSAIQVFTSVAIVACPCALALSAPLTLGFATRVLSKAGLFLKDSAAIEQLASIRHIVFDKTGTLSEANSKSLRFVGKDLTLSEKTIIKSLVAQSGHPTSRQIHNSLDASLKEVSDFKEIKASGIMGKVDEHFIRLGKASWLDQSKAGTGVEINGTYLGYFELQANYRTGLQSMLGKLKQKLFILSGDNDSEKQTLETLFQEKIDMHFEQSPQDKLNFINDLKTQQDTMMLGDGLNDAGALQTANIGLAVADDIHAFFPACDGILKAQNLKHLDSTLSFTQHSMTLIKLCFVISILYNIVGLSFAVTGNLTPLLSAILMPLSSLSILILSATGVAILKKFTFRNGELK
ncbi:MAG: heavy metal translocating P-type ATPase metal-binding domain-containing protein [Lentisphaeraceae bacterium]|nr:heavy metal translocating P-type ATPase metal-binding domain-containing protein [Lentisphaeraceae bacterium]